MSANHTVDHANRYKRIESYACPVCGAQLWGYYEWETERWLVVHGEPDFHERPTEAHLVVSDWQNKFFLNDHEQRLYTKYWCDDLHKRDSVDRHSNYLASLRGPIFV